MSDEEFVTEVAGNFTTLVNAWRARRGSSHASSAAAA
jgi:myo-inositol catabolism protein IolC